MTPPEGAERKAVAADLRKDENFYLVPDLQGDFVKVKYLGLNYKSWYCFNEIGTGNIHGGPDLRNVWLAKTDGK